MRTPFIAGNWKMNKTIDEAVALVKEMQPALDQLKNVDKAVCPPFVALPAVAEALKGSTVKVGAQNMHWEASGAYTGEVAGPMLKALCDYVILGHSERRGYFSETDETVNKKVKAALEYGLLPILCVGETLEQYEAGQTEKVVGAQIRADFDGITAAQARQITVAYEPIWAIGTGKSASAEEANEIIGKVIRGTLAQLYDKATAEDIRIQYGGSANPKNIADYMSTSDIDGALVGGAALKPNDFVEMIKIVSEL